MIDDHDDDHDDDYDYDYYYDYDVYRGLLVISDSLTGSID